MHFKHLREYITTKETGGSGVFARWRFLMSNGTLTTLS